jgi:hypothetical protein
MARDTGAIHDYKLGDPDTKGLAVIVCGTEVALANTRATLILSTTAEVRLKVRITAAMSGASKVRGLDEFLPK